MPHVVFVRAANVGGRNVFRPARLAAALGDLDLVYVGAAGTFVVRSDAAAAAVRRAILAELPFEPEVIVRPARELLALVESDPFKGVSFSKDVRGWAAALARRPKARPLLPLTSPAGPDWSVRVERLEHPYALGLWRRRPRNFQFPGQVVERAVGVPATVRWWETMVRVAELL